MSAAPAPSASDSLEVIRKFAETYAQRTGTYFCSDPGVTAVVLEGLARHKDQLGAALCPCRHYEDKQAEVAQAFWNCPCVPMPSARSAIACSSSPRTTPSAASSRPFRLMRSSPIAPVDPS